MSSSTLLILMFNICGIGWSWPHKTFPRTSTWSTSIPVMLAKLLLKFLVYDVFNYLVQHFRPTVDDPVGATIFDPALSIVLRCAWAVFYAMRRRDGVHDRRRVLRLCNAHKQATYFSGNQSGDGQWSLTAHGCRHQSWSSGTATGTRFSDTCVHLVHGPELRC